jgi:hypothetical protein
MGRSGQDVPRTEGGLPALIGADTSRVSTTDTTGRDWPELSTQAEAEAARYPLKPEYEARVRAAIEAARERLSGDSAARHMVLFQARAVVLRLEALPPHCALTGKMSRGDVFKRCRARQVRRGAVGPARWPPTYGDRARTAKDLLAEEIQRAKARDGLTALMKRSFEAGDEHGPMAAYDQLRGEHCYRTPGSGTSAPPTTRSCT